MSGGALPITRAQFSNNHATRTGGTGVGGAIYASGGTLTITHAQFSNNQAIAGAAILSNGGTLTITHSKFSNNQAVVGGAIGAGEKASIQLLNISFSGNKPSGFSCASNWAPILANPHTSVTTKYTKTC